MLTVKGRERGIRSHSYWYNNSVDRFIIFDLNQFTLLLNCYSL